MALVCGTWARLSAMVALLLAQGGAPAQADWPLARHDARRSGQVGGTGDIRQPAVYWRRYLGGAVGEAAVAVRDLDGDGATEVVLLASGAAVAKSLSDRTVWQSAPLGLRRIVGIADLDGDAADELVVRSDDRVFVFDAAGGTLRWTEPAGEMGTIGDVRMGDVDGDGLPELLIVECGCCRVVSGNSGFVYSFAGSAAAPDLLWQLPPVACGAYNSVTLVDVTGNGSAAVLFGEGQQMVLLDGATGAELARSPILGTEVQRSRCLPTDVDGIVGEELVCVYNQAFDPTSQRRVFVLDYTGPPTPALELRWTAALAPVVGGLLSYVDLVADLEADGSVEVVISARNALGAWSTYVLDGATGTMMATISDEIVAGILPSTMGRPTLLTSSETHLAGWRFESIAAPPISLRWTVLDASNWTAVDPAAAARSAIAARTVSSDLDGDAVPDLLTVGRQEAGALTAFAQTASGLQSIATYQFTGDVVADKAWPVSLASAPDLRLAIASNDGYLVLFGERLALASTGADDASVARLRTGGYYATGFWRNLEYPPRVAALSSGAPQRVVVPDSRRTLLALDAELGSLAAPPTELWRHSGCYSPSVVEGLDSGQRPGVACVAVDLPVTTPPSYRLTAMSGAGEVLWSVPTPSQPLNDVVPGRFDGDAVPDLALQWGAPGDLLLQTRAVSGADGATLWDAVPVDAGAQRQPSGISVGDWDGDGTDDIFYQARATRVLSGADGSQLAFSAAGPAYFMPTLVNVDADAQDEVILHSGLQPVRALDHDLTVLWTSADDDSPYPYGAVADCTGRRLLVEGSQRYPSRLKLTQLSGVGAGSNQFIVLAGGARFDDETQATLSGASSGQLTTANVHRDLTGTGHPTAVVGSSDGWLYAVDPCTTQLDFALRFDAAVGEPVFGDTDGDGRDEILVTVADGYLYALRNFELPAPAAVWDADPQDLGTYDLSEVQTTSALGIAWVAVDGAEYYEAAVVDEQARYVTSPPWIEVGASTRARLEGLELVDGARYRVAVRARAAGLRSVDTVSDGIVVRFPGGSDAGPTRPPPAPGCGCRSSRPDAAVAAIAALSCLLIGGARRRAQRSPGGERGANSMGVCRLSRSPNQYFSCR